MASLKYLVCVTLLAVDSKQRCKEQTFKVRLRFMFHYCITQ